LRITSLLNPITITVMVLPLHSILKEEPIIIQPRYSYTWIPYDEISLILIYGRPGDNKGGGSASMSFSGLPGDTSIIVKDDPGDTYSINPPNGSVEHSWGGNGTDGVVLGTWDLVDNFSCTLSVDSFTDIDTIRVLGDNWDTVQMDMSTDITLTVDH